MLEARGITARFESKDALRNVTISVAPGERVVLLGKNGSGKSTLLKCLSAQMWPAVGAIALDGRPIRTNADVGCLRRCVGVVGQDPDNQMVASSLFDEVAFGPCNLGLGANEVRERVQRALLQCNLAGMERRKVETLSGGQRQRAALAGVLAMEPSYMLCDEPCSMLDPKSRCEVMDILEGVARDGCGVVVITHELSDVISFDRAVVLEQGSVVWQGTPVDLLMDEMQCRRAACNVSTGLARLADRVRAGSMTPGELATCSTGDIVREGLRGAASRAAQSTVSPKRDDGDYGAAGCEGLRLRDVSHAYRLSGGRTCQTEARNALGCVSLACGPGSVCALVGPTGSGKTSLAKIAAGLMEPSEGEVCLDGHTVEAGTVSYVFQRAEDQLFATTVVDDVSFGPRNQGLRKKDACERALRALQRMGLDARACAPENPFSLSGGQMRRVAIAGVLAMENRYVVFDEPTVGLDAPGIECLGEVVADLKRDGVGVMMITHDVERAVAWSDRMVVVSDGALVWEGPPAELAEHLDVLERAGLIPKRGERS